MNKAAVPGLVKRTTHWLLLVVTVLFLITGFGISEFRVVETITLGWLTKSWALRLHDNLWIPFVVLLILHVCLPLVLKSKPKKVEL
jgi:cytochrome b subunit of formate dehydrogenase